MRDFEDGPWTFYGPDGAVEKAGQYDNGKQSGFWRFYFSGGRPRAEGLYHRGRRLGPWQVWTEAGATRVQDFGQQAGVQLVRELWPDTQQVRRAGVLQNGVPAGRWSSFHRNGKERLACGMAAGGPAGTFDARDEQGAVIAQGRFNDGQLAAGGSLVVDGNALELAAGPLAARDAAVEVWVDDAAAAAERPEQRLARFFAEQAGEVGDQPFAAIVIEQPADAPQVTTEQAEAEIVAIDAEPQRQPASPQPLTLDERKKLDTFRDIYAGKRSGRTLLNSDIYKPQPGDPRPKGGAGRRKGLEGRQLPFQVLSPVDGGEVDLRGYRGQKRILLVVLRGFLGKVCEYCVAQTAALSDAKEELAAQNVEVLVIYPGARENVESFRILYEEEFGEGPPPYRVFYDEDLELVALLGIEGDLASPSTFLVNQQGVVEFAYVGKHKADRPSVIRLKKLIEGLGK